MSAYIFNDSATAALSIMFAQAMELDEPSMRNSNLLPVKAKGEVRFLSVVSRTKRGRVSTPSFIFLFSMPKYGLSVSMASSTPVSS